jgi:hypothetical protein
LRWAAVEGLPSRGEVIFKENDTNGTTVELSVSNSFIGVDMVLFGVIFSGYKNMLNSVHSIIFDKLFHTHANTCNSYKYLIPVADITLVACSSWSSHAIKCSQGFSPGKILLLNCMHFVKKSKLCRTSL